MIAFILGTFLSAFLLFSVQPLLGRYILPWFGGSPSVWTSCMLFFQIGLLLGYAYAFGLSRRSSRVQGGVHLALLLLSLLLLPLDPAGGMAQIVPDGSPARQIPVLLLTVVGLPFGILSATAPLLQHWFAERFPGTSPYRLYALSNTGSMLALLGYPLLWEPFFNLRQQSLAWSLLYLLFALVCGSLALAKLRNESNGPITTAQCEPGPDHPPLTAWRTTGWILLPALGSTLLLATTNQLCLDVASVPFLWVLPLVLYLCTFILTFESERWYRRWLWGGLMAVFTPLGWYAFYHGTSMTFLWQLLIFSATLFIGCMLCHGELYQLRPGSRHLTLFYLCMAGGGAIGGLFVSLLAPALFTSYREYEIALVGTCLLTVVAWSAQRAWSISFRQPLFWIVPLLVAYVLASPAIPILAAKDQQSRTIEQVRNFYGTLAVTGKTTPLGEVLTMVNGRINHGSQFIDPERRLKPLTYYAPGSPVDTTFQLLRLAKQPEAPLRVGIVGAGTGSMAAFGTTGDRFLFYEINPQVIELARRHFSFLQDSTADVEIRIGDGRILLERDLRETGPQEFDLLAIDAFSGDAIPMHLLTLESFELFLGHLSDQGTLILHLSNRFVDLVPVALGIAGQLGWEALRLEADTDPTVMRERSIWVVLSRSQPLLAALRQQPIYAPQADIHPLVFSDDYSSLLKVLKL